MNRDPEVVLTDMVETQEPSGVAGISVTSTILNGVKWFTPVVQATQAWYHEINGREEITAERLAELEGKKVTLLRNVRGAFGHTAINEMQGTLFPARNGTAILPKGKRKGGPLLKPEDVLDIEVGYNKGAALRERVETARSAFPEVGPLEQSDLDALPSNSNTCSLAVFASVPMPDGTMTGAIYLCHEYMRGDDIVENMLIVPEGQWYSEHGSMYGKDMLRFGGKVQNFEPMSMKEAFALADMPYLHAVAYVMLPEKRPVIA